MQNGCTFLTHHAHVLISIAKDPNARMRDLAQSVGITERATQRIVSELEQEGFIQIVKEGRRNRYQLNLKQPFKHPVEQELRVDKLLPGSSNALDMVPAES